MPRKPFRIACAAALPLAVLVLGSAGASGQGIGQASSQANSQASGSAPSESTPQAATDPVAPIVAQPKSDDDRADAALIHELTHLRTRAAPGGIHLRLE